MPRDMRKLLGVMDMFIILNVMMVLQVYTYVKSFQNIHFQYEQFIVYQLYFSKAVKKKKLTGLVDGLVGAGEEERNIRCDPQVPGLSL